jgi:hypothetical protein
MEHEHLMPQADKILENRLRRELDRMGYRLQKSRARDPHALTYGGYQIKDLGANALAAGCGNADRGFSLRVDDVEAWIRDARRLHERSAGRTVAVTGRSR